MCFKKVFPFLLRPQIPFVPHFRSESFISSLVARLPSFSLTWKVLAAAAVVGCAAACPGGAAAVAAVAPVGSAWTRIWPVDVCNNWCPGGACNICRKKEEQRSKTLTCSHTHCKEWRECLLKWTQWFLGCSGSWWLFSHIPFKWGSDQDNGAKGA